MVETTKKLIENLDEFINLMVKNGMDVNGLKTMDQHEIAEIKKGLEVIDGCKKLLVKEAETLERIEGKLDKLLAK